MAKENHDGLSDDFRKTFGLTKPEGVIQNYHCSYGITPGVLYISQNYVCFQGSKDPIKIPFVKVTNVDLQGISGFHKVHLVTDTAQYSFGLFQWAPHCRHSYNLMMHIWKNPPTYVDVQAIRHSAATIDRSTEQQSTQQRAKVNVDKARELLRIVSETDDMQNQAMQQITEQGEALDRIEGKLESINDDLKRADKLMKGIESLPYYLFGGSAKKDVKDQREKQLKDRTIKVPAGTPPVIEIEMLYKGSDSLDPAIIVFEPEKFKLVNPKNDKLLASGMSYEYIDVDTVTIRSRNEYMDIKFNTKKKEPVRLCSAYLQIITNQLHTRALKIGHDITVNFESPTQRKFEYEDEWIYKLPPHKRGTGQGKGLVGTTNFTKLSSLVTDEEQKRDLNEVDDTLDQVSSIVGGIIDKGIATNHEIERQIGQIKKMEGMSDEAVGRMQNLNVRMDKAT